MGTKEISLDEDAYECLRDAKRDNESYSDVVKRLVGHRSWHDVAGIWDDATDDLSMLIESGREFSRDRRDCQ